MHAGPSNLGQCPPGSTGGAAVRSFCGCPTSHCAAPRATGRKSGLGVSSRSLRTGRRRRSAAAARHRPAPLWRSAAEPCQAGRIGHRARSRTRACPAHRVGCCADASSGRGGQGSRCTACSPDRSRRPRRRGAPRRRSSAVSVARIGNLSKPVQVTTRPRGLRRKPSPRTVFVPFRAASASAAAASKSPAGCGVVGLPCRLGGTAPPDRVPLEARAPHRWSSVAPPPRPAGSTDPASSRACTCAAAGWPQWLRFEPGATPAALADRMAASEPAAQ